MLSLHPFRAPFVAAAIAAAAVYAGWHTPLSVALFVGAMYAVISIGESIVLTMNHNRREMK